MTKTELVRKMADEFPELTIREIERAIDIIFNEISNSLAKGTRVELRGFGAFSVRYRDRRMARNPRTGEKVEVEGRNVPFFKAGKSLRERINGDQQSR